MGGIVPVINIAGIKSGDIVLDGPTLARIYLGEIVKWDDAAIKALNPETKLPSAHITVVHRSDGSGTTFNFTNYLSKVSEKWQAEVGYEVSVEWPVGVGAKANRGVASEVADTEGAIGYVDYAYAKQQELAYARMINKDGNVVAPRLESFQAAAANADWATRSFGVVLTDQPGEASWPITVATFILMHTAPDDPEASRQALAFFDWAYANGDGMASELDYIPVPDGVVELVHKEWASIKDASGQPPVRHELVGWGAGAPHFSGGSVGCTQWLTAPALAGSTAFPYPQAETIKSPHFNMIDCHKVESSVS